MARLKLLIYVLPALLSLQTLATRRRASQALFVSVHQGVRCEWWIIVCVINRKVKCVCVDHLGSVSNRLWRNSHTGQPGMITVQKDRSLLLYTNQACNYVTFTEGDVTEQLSHGLWHNTFPVKRESGFTGRAIYRHLSPICPVIPDCWVAGFWQTSVTLI